MNDCLLEREITCEVPLESRGLQFFPSELFWGALHKGLVDWYCIRGVIL